MSFLHPLRQPHYFQKVSMRKCPTSDPKDNPEEEVSAHQEQVYEVPQDRVICSASILTSITTFSRIIYQNSGTSDFLNTQRQRKEFVDSPPNEIGLSYVIYPQNFNKCDFLTDTNELKSAPFSIFPFSTKFVTCKDRHLHISKSKLEISKNESLHSWIDTPSIRFANEG